VTAAAARARDAAPLPAATPFRAAAPFRVALTFDAEHPDRPSTPGVQERLLELLDHHRVRASFFVQGRWAEAYPRTAAGIREGGHLVGNHSHYHARMPLLNARGLRSDIAEAGRHVLEATGIDPRPWFRCPFGAGVEDQRVQRFIREAGYRHVGWHVAGLDWPAERTGTEVEEAVVRGAIQHGDGCVVLLHTWPDRTEQALGGIVRRLHDAGATFVRIDELAEAEVPEHEVPEDVAAAARGDAPVPAPGVAGAA
jgi:peptidoglycan/xylan/chitin deacetylase (PgdA/CDA1 family)